MHFRQVVILCCFGWFAASCEKVDSKFFAILSQVNDASHRADLESFNEAMNRFNVFLEKHKIWEKGSFLGEQGVSLTVAYVNCLEGFKALLEKKQGATKELDKWEFHARDIENPLNKMTVQNYQAAVESLKKKVSKAQGVVTQVSNSIVRTRLECDGIYSKLTSIQ